MSNLRLTLHQRYYICLLTFAALLVNGYFAHSTRADSAAGNVTAFRNDPGHDGYIDATVNTPLSLLWRYTTTPAPASPASPVVANGVVYFGSGSHIFAVHASDGSLAWEFPATGTITGTFDSTPTLSDGALYIGSDDMTLYKIDAKTGSQLWSQKVGGAIRGAPAIENGIVYFGSADNHCYAADTGTGSILWSFLTNGAVTTTPVLSPTAVYFASADDSIYCLNLKTGQKIWSSQFSSDPSTAPPVYADGSLYVVAGNTLYAMDAPTGQSAWSKQFDQDITTPPTVGAEFIGVGTVDGAMTMLDRHGRVLWADNLGYPSYGDPMLTDNVFLVPTQHGLLYALAPRTGKLVWEYVLPASTAQKENPAPFTNIDSSPALADGTLYVLGDDGTLSALRHGVLDTLPPVVTAMTPTPAATVPGVSVYPSATVTDDGCGVNPTTVSMTLDGLPVLDVVYIAATRTVMQDTSSATAPEPTTLADGPHEVVVTATDWLGNKISKSWGFFVDNKYDPKPGDSTDNSSTDDNGDNGDNGDE